MTTTEDRSAQRKQAAKVKTQKLKVKEKLRCSMVTMLPRSFHCEPQKARLSGRDDKQQQMDPGQGWQDGIRNCGQKALHS